MNVYKILKRRLGKQRGPSHVYVNDRVDYGLIIRNKISYIGKKLSPVFRKIFPNFVAAHYGYIITICIIGSILIYPVKNLRYIDALFFAVGASTQAGLNTIDTNTITLYQQLVIYLIAMFTTPIFIHSGILVIRLYWFERHFDNIKETSKLNFKMRKTATLAARTLSQGLDRSSTRLNTVNNTGIGMNYNLSDNMKHQRTEEKGLEKLVSPNQKPTDSSSNTNSLKVALTSSDTTNRSLSNSEGVLAESKIPKIESNPDFAVTGIEPDSRDIKFGNLPHPRRRHEEINPSDMLMSISMLQKYQTNSKSNIEDDEEQGPALIIKSPKEIEKENDRINSLLKATSRRKSSFQLDVRPKLKSLRKSFSNADNSHPASQVIEDNDEESINSEEGNDNEDIFEEDEHEGTDIKRAKSNIQLQTNNMFQGKKFSKRSNTLEIPPNQKNGKSKIVKSPTFERLIKNRLSKQKTRYYQPANHHHESGDDEEGDDNLLSKMSTNYLSWNPVIGRNSTFVHLSEEQKNELGGVEYRAIKLLIKILVVYYVGLHIVAFLFLVPWILPRTSYVEKVRAQGISPTWWGFFTAASAFNDLGITLTADSMQSFSQSIYVMIIVSFFVVVGNTGFPIFLRFVIWLLCKTSKPLSLYNESLEFLLDHPRRCFTLLFPSIPTWWLFFILVVLNSIDLVLFVILDFNNSSLTSTPKGFRVMDGLFQAFSTRTAGFAVVNLAALHPAIQVSYMLMMYISVLPLAISIRRTNVYEEQSLGVYYKNEDDYPTEDHEKSTRSFIGTHLRKQLSFDLWFIFLGLFVICICEGKRLKDTSEYYFTVFQVLFEIISAYGTVGLSLGYPGINASFSGEFTTLSKLIIIAMMIRGRHRGLPYALDRAIMLPNDAMKRRDDVQAHHALRRNATVDTNGHHDNPVLSFIRRTSTNASGGYDITRRFSFPHSNRNHFHDDDHETRASHSNHPNQRGNHYNDDSQNNFENDIKLQNLSPVPKNDAVVEESRPGGTAPNTPSHLNFEIPPKPHHNHHNTSFM